MTLSGQESCMIYARATLRGMLVSLLQYCLLRSNRRPFKSSVFKKSPRFSAFFVFRVFNTLSISSFLFHCIMNGTPLSSISDNHRRHHRYILYQKELFYEVIDDELTLLCLEKQYHVPKSFVRHVLFTYKSRLTKVLNSRSDKFKVFTTRE